MADKRQHGIGKRAGASTAPVPDRPGPVVLHGILRPGMLRFWALRFALAYVLVMQGVLGAVAAGANVPVAGNAQIVLCQGGLSPSDDAPPASAPHDALCCIVGCINGFAPVLPASGRAFTPPPETGFIRLAMPQAQELPMPRPAPASFQPRAPPGRV